MSPQAEARTAGAAPGSSSSLSPDAAAVLDAIIDADAEHPVKQDRIAERTGLSVRTVQDALKRLREDHGIPAVSRCRPPYGCFIAQSPSEAREYVQQLRARITSLYKSIKAVDAAAAREWLAEQQADLPLRDGDDLRARSDGGGKRACLWCDETFKPLRDDHRFCSDDCRMYWHRRKS